MFNAVKYASSEHRRQTYNAYTRQSTKRNEEAAERGRGGGGEKNVLYTSNERKSCVLYSFYPILISDGREEERLRRKKSFNE